MKMTLDLSNAYRNLLNLKTASGLEIPDDMSPWFESYTNAFLNVLTNSGYNENEINIIVKIIHEDSEQYSYNNQLARSDPRDFGPEEINEKHRCAAYGLLVFDEIIRLFKNPTDQSLIFAYHELLIESAQHCNIVIYSETLDKSRMSNIGSLGGINRHQPTAKLKAWALQQPEALRMPAREASEYLSARIPAHLADASKNPEQLIYRALLARHQAK